MATAPQTTPYQRNRIGEGRQFFLVPSSRANRHLLTFGRLVCHQGHDREESKQRRSCPGNRQVTPLSLRFYSYVRPGLFKGHFHAPTSHKPGQDLQRRVARIGTDKGLRIKLALRVTYQHPANQDRLVARFEPPRDSRRLQFLRGWSHENNNEIFAGV